MAEGPEGLSGDTHAITSAADVTARGATASTVHERSLRTPGGASLILPGLTELVLDQPLTYLFICLAYPQRRWTLT